MAAPHRSSSAALAALTAALTLSCVSLAQAQRTNGNWLADCDSRHGWSNDRDQERRCEVRELTIAAPAASRALRVDGGQNGGVEIQGESRRDVVIEARIQAQASSGDEARAMLTQIRIDTSGGVIRADGPSNSGRRNWSVSFVISTPSRIDLDLRAHNGGVSVNNVQGRMELSTQNGGLHLSGVGGDVHGETQNGGLRVELDGEKWQGQGLDVRTTNGGVHMNIPARYAAHLETGTTNGGMEIDFPVVVQGRIGRQISTDLNGGGTTIRAITTNGGVSIVRK